MSITLQSLVDRATEMALVGTADDLRSEYIKTGEMLAETLVPQVFQAAARDAAGDPDRAQQVLYTFTLNFTAGSVAMPGNVLTEFLNQAQFSDTGDSGAPILSAWVRYYLDFVNNPDTRLPYFTENPAGTLLYSPAGSTYAPGSGDNFGGSLTMVVPASPIVPDDPNEVIDVQPEFEDSLVTALSSALQNSAAWQVLSGRLTPGDNS